MSLEKKDISSLLQNCLLCGSAESQHQITKGNREKWTDDFCKLYDVDLTCIRRGEGEEESELLEIRHTLQTANYCLDCLSKLQSISAFYKTIDEVNMQLKVIQLQCESQLESSLEALGNDDDDDENQDNYVHMYMCKRRLLNCMQTRRLNLATSSDDDGYSYGKSGKEIGGTEEWHKELCFGSSSQSMAHWKADLKSEPDTEKTFSMDFELIYDDGDGDVDNLNDAGVRDNAAIIHPQPFPCTHEGCQKSFDLAVDLEEHIKRNHEGLKYPFPCDKCSKPCYSYSKFQDHQNIHNGLTPYECPDPNCRKKFPTRFMLTCHRRTKKIRKGGPALSPQPPPPDQFELLAQLDLAPILSNDSTSQHEASQLILTMLERKQQEDEAESTPKSLAQAPRKRQPRKDLDLPFQFSCTYPECMKQFRKEVQREGHIKVYHEKSIKYPFPCELCSKRCFSYEKLVQHGNIHLDLKPYPCPDPDCHKNFATEQLLYFHRRHKKIRKGSWSHSTYQARNKSKRKRKSRTTTTSESLKVKAQSGSTSKAPKKSKEENQTRSKSKMKISTNGTTK